MMMNYMPFEFMNESDPSHYSVPQPEFILNPNHHLESNLTSFDDTISSHHPMVDPILGMNFLLTDQQQMFNDITIPINPWGNEFNDNYLNTLRWNDFNFNFNHQTTTIPFTMNSSGNLSHNNERDEVINEAIQNQMIPITSEVQSQPEPVIDHPSPITASSPDSTYPSHRRPPPPSSTTYGYPTRKPTSNLHIPRPKRTLLSRPPSQSYRCQFCGQPFERGNSLRRHEFLHTGKKPYKCLPCDKSFSRLDIYHRHQTSSRCRLATAKVVTHPHPYL